MLAVGTSLSGMNADRLVSTCASRARSQQVSSTRGPLGRLGALLTSASSAPASGAPVALGSVIVSLQRTPHDANSSLRIYALIDDVMALLAEELGLEVGSGNTPASSTDDVYQVPYNLDGTRVPAGAPLHTLDLREGATVMLTDGPQKGEKAVVMGRNADGHWRVKIAHRFNGSNATFGEVRLLGSWWPVEAAAGLVQSIPVVSVPGLSAEVQGFLDKAQQGAGREGA